MPHLASCGSTDILPCPPPVSHLKPYLSPEGSPLCPSGAWASLNTCQLSPGAPSWDYFGPMESGVQSSQPDTHSFRNKRAPPAAWGSRPLAKWWCPLLWKEVGFSTQDCKRAYERYEIWRGVFAKGSEVISSWSFLNEWENKTVLKGTQEVRESFWKRNLEKFSVRSSWIRQK